MKKTVKIIIIVLLAAAVLFGLLYTNVNNGHSTKISNDDTKKPIVIRTGENAEHASYSDIIQLTDLLYELTYEDYEWDYVNSYMSKYKIEDSDMVIAGGCSGIQIGSLRGRNEDWYMDNQTEFVLYTNATDTRHATISVISQSGITQEELASENISDKLALLPFRVSDGMNDAGLCTQVNVVPVEDAEVLTTGTNPGGEDMFITLVQRYILDYASDVDEAIEMIKEKNLFGPHSETMNQEIHFMISDLNKCVIVEFINNEVKIIENENVMTNFYAYYDELTPHSQGVERYNILKEGADSVESSDDMIDLMKKVWFTKAYDRNTEPFWYSDFTDGSITIDTAHDDAELNSIIDGDIELFQTGERQDSLWITTHTSVYDQKNLTLKLLAQETDTVYEFKLK